MKKLWWVASSTLLLVAAVWVGVFTQTASWEDQKFDCDNDGYWYHCSPLQEWDFSCSYGEDSWYCEWILWWQNVIINNCEPHWEWWEWYYCTPNYSCSSNGDDEYICDLDNEWDYYCYGDYCYEEREEWWQYFNLCQIEEDYDEETWTYSYWPSYSCRKWYIMEEKEDWYHFSKDWGWYFSCWYASFWSYGADVLNTMNTYGDYYCYSQWEGQEEYRFCTEQEDWYLCPFFFYPRSTNGGYYLEKDPNWGYVCELDDALEIWDVSVTNLGDYTCYNFWDHNDEYYNCEYEWYNTYFCPQFYSFYKNSSSGEYIFEPDSYWDYICNRNVIRPRWWITVENISMGDYYCYNAFNNEEMRYNNCYQQRDNSELLMATSNNPSSYACPILYSCESESWWFYCEEKETWEYFCKSNSDDGRVEAKWLTTAEVMWDYSCYTLNEEILSNNCQEIQDTPTVNDLRWTPNQYFCPQESIISKTVKVVRDDGDNQDNLRPSSISVKLYADGSIFNEAVQLSSDNNWETIVSVPEYNNGWNLITYTWVVDEIQWYEITQSTNESVTVLSIKHTPTTNIVTYTVTFKDYDGRVIKVVLVREWENAELPANPTRNWYKFIGWDVDLTNVTFDVVATAQYSPESSWYSGWGSRWGWSKPEPSHNSADDDKNVETKSLPNNDVTKKEVEPKDNSTDTQPQDWWSKNGWTTVGEKAEQYTKETTEAYTWAFTEWLTKYNNISDARMWDFLNRSEMAKITTIFATKFRWETPDENKKEFCSKYSDLWKVEEDTKEYIIQSCELWYMWYQANWVDALERFRPYTPVSVAEVSIILSRLMWWNRYAVSENKWYQWHLWAVYEHRLIDNISKPFNDITRKDAFTMLYRLSSSDILRD